MTAPRLEVDLAKIQHNTRILVARLKKRGISVSGVTKATLGAPEIARTMLAAGVENLADSRIENIETMRHAGIQTPITLIRSPMLSQAKRVVRHANASLNTELDVVAALSDAAQKIGRTHDVVLMVELGDLREGIMPADLKAVVRRTLTFPNIALKGIGTNLACRSGVAPDAMNMGELSKLAEAMEGVFGQEFPLVSGGNSSNLDWALSGADIGRINNLRLGEAILLGCEPLYRQPIEGLCTDAIVLVAEVIESKIKPSQPWGAIAETAFGVATPSKNIGNISQAIFAIGHMDTDPVGLTPPSGVKILGSSSDHLVVDAGSQLLPIGTEIRFQLNYSALTRAMASPLVKKEMQNYSKGRAMTKL